MYRPQTLTVNTFLWDSPAYIPYKVRLFLPPFPIALRAKKQPPRHVRMYLEDVDASLCVKAYNDSLLSCIPTTFLVVLSSILGPWEFDGDILSGIALLGLRWRRAVRPGQKQGISVVFQSTTSNTVTTKDF